MKPRALFAGPGAARALVPGRVGLVELVFSGGAYVRFEDDWVLVCEPGAPFGPLSVTVSALCEIPLAVGASAAVTSEQLVLGDAPVSLSRVRFRRPPALLVAERPHREAAVAVLAALPPPPARLRDGLDALSAGRVGDGVRALAGLGEGLTAAGDDILAGAAAALWSRGIEAPCMSKLAAGRCSPLGLAYLRCAERGELPDPAAQLLSAIASGSPGSARAALPALQGWGATSGTALAWGICAPHTSYRYATETVRGPIATGYR